MINKMKIKSVKKDRVIDTGEYFLDVEVDLIEAVDGTETVVETRKFGFDYSVSAQAIETELAKSLETIIEDAQRAVSNKVSEQLEKQADEAIAALTDKEIVKV